MTMQMWEMMMQLQEMTTNHNDQPQLQDTMMATTMMQLWEMTMQLQERMPM